ncbi:hypothetical protein Slin15195_G128980 [Septoria linicola]|uniref:Uncharacterized protein n=1 Tax=Septoria linicola TaxID=215465 RepID=A0A9Q9ER68_9PEZI|nr:hypothetical protein Slin14017_G085180 [Septoria linicola]USW59579.1 hypothetical protein Slin15195_G128980 [Septoria linicola]
MTKSKGRTKQVQVSPPISKAPQTASLAVQSIWQSVDRAPFERDVVRLHQQAHRHCLSGLESQKKASLHKTNLGYGLPLAVETRLATDFAYVAAWNCDPSRVAAATVSEDKPTNGLTISLAANEGIPPQVEVAVRGILNHLRKSASLEISREDCVNACCRDIVRLCHARIRARLIWRGNTKPVHLKDRLQDLSRTFGDLLKPGTKDFLVRLNVLIDHIECLSNASLDKETSAKTCEIMLIIIQAAYDVAYGIASEDGLQQSRELQPSVSRFGGITIDEQCRQRREIRSILALAEYWRICLFRTACTRSYRQHFQRLTLRIVKAPKPEIWPRKSGLKHFVHAEVQLLIYHESASLDLKPRTIVASKLPCYLCCVFILCYGGYRIPQSHGEVHHQWTVIDDPKLASPVRVNVHRALSEMHGIIQDTLSGPKKQHTKAPHAQSLLNLTICTLRPPSVISLTPAGKEGRTPVDNQPLRSAQGPSALVAISDQHDFSVNETIHIPAVRSAGPDLDASIAIERRDSALNHETDSQTALQKLTSDVNASLHGQPDVSVIASTQECPSTSCPLSEPHHEATAPADIARPSQAWLSLLPQGASRAASKFDAPAQARSITITESQLVSHQWLDLHMCLEPTPVIPTAMQLGSDEHCHRPRNVRTLDFATFTSGSEVDLSLDEADHDLWLVLQLPGHKDISFCMQRLQPVST